MLAELNRNLKDYIIIKEVNVTISSIAPGGSFKITTSIPQVDGYEPLLASAKGSGHNQIYNYYVGITDNKTGVYTEWRSIASSATLSNVTARINVIYIRN